jgi:hypothetical protein
VFIEQDKSIGALLAKNIEMLGAKERSELIIGDALGPGALARAPRPLTLAFLDPPYPLVQEAVGFKRTMAQVQKLVDLLTLDGFVVLRTPWPLKHKQGSPAPVSSPMLKRGKGRTPRFEREVLEPTVVPGRAAHGLRARDEELEEMAGLSPTVAKAVWTDVDLHLPNAAGPETHAYANMAVHLYMRKP